LEAFLISTGVVALAEFGDKTQLLAFLWAAKFRRPVPIILAILCAILVNHGLAGVVGVWIHFALPPGALRWILGASFLGMAVWTLVPDRFEEKDARFARFGVFGTTLLAFFLAEMGDKTQIATLALAAKYHALLPVVAGTTVGMMLADVPAVFLGDRMAHRMPVRWVRALAAAIFAVLGVATLLGAGARLGV
jgi:putative Ca2+/H+ antiporter (TMEM165/GDT1 family)